jgi:hypothetical protein
MMRANRTRWAILTVTLAVLFGAAILGSGIWKAAPASTPSGSVTAKPVLPSATFASGVSGPWARLAPWPRSGGPTPTASLAAWHDGFVAIDQSGPLVAVWYSPDGRAWTRSIGADTAFAGVDVVWLVGAPGGFVALGMPRPIVAGSSPAPSRPADAQPVCGGFVWWSGGACEAWISTDGRSWRKLDAAALFSNSGIVDVAAGPLGLVAIGYGSESMPGPAQIWYSADGSSWRSVDLPASMHWSGPQAVAADPDGFEIVGEPQLTDIGNNIRPGAWWSTDGLAWTQAGMPYDQWRDSGSSLQKVFVGRDGMVALVNPGRLASGPAEFQSADGRSWQWRNPTDITPLISDGTRMIGQEARFPGLYHSYDGIEWTPLPLEGGDLLAPTCAVAAIAPTGLLVAGDSCPVRFLAGLP